MNYDKGYFDSPEFRELLKRYEQAVRMGTTPYFGADEFTDIMSYYLSIDKHEEATETLATAKRLHPAAPESVKMEIKLLLCKGEPENAMKLFPKIGYVDDDTKILQAEILLALKEFRYAHDIAIDILRNAKPGHENIYDALEILIDCGFAQEALIICEKALKATPEMKSLHEVKAECLIELQHTSEAIEIYNRLLDEEPYSTLYWEQLGHVYYMIKRYGKAIECFEFENTINDEIEYARMMQAYCYYHVGDYKQAKEIFTEFGQKYPKSATPLFYIALSEYHEGNHGTALELFNQVISKAPEGTIEIMLARLNKAMIQDEDGLCERADEAVAMAIMMHPDNMKQLVLHGTHLYELRDKENLTFDDMNILEAKEWSQNEEMYHLGVHLVEHKHFKLAKRVMQYTREFAKDTSDIDAYIAYILWNCGEKEKSRSAMENAIEEKSDLLFRLFGLVYNSNTTTEEFIGLLNDRK